MKANRIFAALLFLIVATSEASGQALASYGSTVYTFLTFTNATGNGTAFAIPQASIAYIAWCTSFGSAPASITVNLQVSNDNSAWSTADTSTSTTAECRSIFSANKFVRGNISAVSGGTTTTVSINIQRVSTSNSNINTNVAAIATKLLLGNGTAAAPSLTFSSDSDTGLFKLNPGELHFTADGVAALRLSGGNGLILPPSSFLAWGSIGVTTSDVLLYRDTSNTLGLRNGTNAQTFRVYNTFTDASNGEWASIEWGGNNFNILTRNNGTGSARPMGLGTAGTAILNFYTGAVVRFRVDTTGNLVGVTATGGLGYATGSGGTVTQATSKVTGVTLNTVTGEITLNAAALAADTAVSFTLTDSAIAVGDYILCQRISGGTAGAYACDALAAAGSATITITNRTPGALSEAPVIKFMVFRSATS